MPLSAQSAPAQLGPAQLAAVVLAGGASRRMGRDKATLVHPGSGPGQARRVTMVEHVVSVVAARCAPVIVVAAPGQALPELTGVQVLRDEIRGIGPLLAAGRGLRLAAEAGCARAFVCAVDMPYLTVDLIEELSRRGSGDEAAGDEGEADVVLPWDGRDHYLAGVYRTALAATIDALVDAGERRMRALTDTVVTRRVVLSPGSRVLTNLNTEADLRDSAR